MADDNSPLSSTQNAHQWDPDVVFWLLGDPLRRQLFFTLGRSGLKSGSELKTSAARNLGATLKHLALMCEAGFIVKTANPKDGRQPLYGLAPLVPLKKTESGSVIDFGFCLLRL